MIKFDSIEEKKGFNASINSIIDLEDPSTLDYILNPTNELYEILGREKVKGLLRISLSSIY